VGQVLKDYCSSLSSGSPDMSLYQLQCAILDRLSEIAVEHGIGFLRVDSGVVTASDTIDLGFST